MLSSPDEGGRETKVEREPRPLLPVTRHRFEERR